MADNFDFGTWPLNFVKNVEGLYEIVAEHAGNAAACGIDATFDAGRRAIMEARAAAYGYQLSEYVPEPDPVPPDGKAKAS